jgi:hypothetical protein
MIRKVLFIALLATASVAAQAQQAFGFTSNMDSSQEVANPAIVNDAFGVARVRVVVDTNGRHYIEGGFRLRNMSARPSAYHIHLGAAGVNGGVAIGLDNLFTTITNVGTSGYNVYFRGEIVGRTVSGTFFTPAQILARMRAGTAYFNVHNSVFPGGEVRGQTIEFALP